MSDEEGSHALTSDGGAPATESGESIIASSYRALTRTFTVLRATVGGAVDGAIVEEQAGRPQDAQDARAEAVAEEQGARPQDAALQQLQLQEDAVAAQRKRLALMALTPEEQAGSPKDARKETAADEQAGLAGETHGRREAVSVRRVRV